MNKLLITACLILLSLNCFSTCIAIYIADNGNIYVAADSRRTFLFNAGKDINKPQIICKIHHVGNNYFAISGIDDGGLLQAATASLQQSADIDSAVRSFGAAMIKRYKRLMDYAKIFYPDKFARLLSDGLGNVSFFGFYKGAANVVNIQFVAYLDKSNQIAVAYRIRQIYDVTVLGISKDITAAGPDELPSKTVMEQTPELYVEGLVKIEAKKRPQAVSEPIDLLELKPDGAVWIRKNENAVVY